MTANTDYKFEVTTFRGLELLLAKELSAIGAQKVREDFRKVHCTGDLGFLYKANFSLRTAVNVRLEMGRFKFVSPADLIARVVELDWSVFAKTDSAISIACEVSNAAGVSGESIRTGLTGYLSGAFAEITFVETGADLDISIEIVRDKCIVLLNSSGPSLSKRGYATDTGTDINAVMAIGIVLLSGWEPHTALVNFVCKSAVIPIEAALYAAKIPPGTFRSKFAFETWANFDEALFTVIRDKQLSRIVDNNVKIYASDPDPANVKLAIENVNAAGVDDMVQVTCLGLDQVSKVTQQGTIVLCPVAEEAITDEQAALIYEKIGVCLKQNFAGYKAWLCTDASPVAGNIGLRYSRKFELDNDTATRMLFKYNLFEG